MFLAGAAIGFFVIWYYVDLFGFFNYGSSRGYGLVVGTAGAILIGIISALFIRAVAIFAAAAVIGYLAIAFGWIAYAHFFDIADREGGKGMAIIFILAPVGGAMVGLIAASLLSRRGMPGPGPAPTNVLARERSG
jgi:hypothetical protein